MKNRLLRHATTNWIDHCAPLAYVLRSPYLRHGFIYHEVFFHRNLCPTHKAVLLAEFLNFILSDLPVSQVTLKTKLPAD